MSEETGYPLDWHALMAAARADGSAVTPAFWHPWLKAAASVELKGQPALPETFTIAEGSLAALAFEAGQFPVAALTSDAGQVPVLEAGQLPVAAQSFEAGQLPVDAQSFEAGQPPAAA